MLCADLKQNERIVYETGVPNQFNPTPQNTWKRQKKKKNPKQIQFHTPAEFCPISEKIAPGVHSGTSAWDSNMLKMISQEMLFFWKVTEKKLCQQQIKIKLRYNIIILATWSGFIPSPAKEGGVEGSPGLELGWCGTHMRVSLWWFCYKSGCPLPPLNGGSLLFVTLISQSP